MKTVIATLLLLIMQQVPRTRGIEGIVVDAVSGRPIANATVYPSMRRTSQTQTRTNDSGHFRLEGLQLGRQQIGANATGFADAEVTIDITSDEPKDLTVRLWRAGVVTGQVIDTRGRPVVRAKVSLVAYQFLGRFRSTHAGTEPITATLTELFQLPRALDPNSTPDTTNDQGTFRLDVPSGDYYLRIEPSLEDQLTAGFGAIFYPGVAGVSRAEPIRVAAGSETRLNTVTFAPAPRGWIKVRVVDSAGDPLGLSSLTIADGLLIRSASTGWTESTTIRDRGVWSIRPSETGKHRVCSIRLVPDPDPNFRVPIANPLGCVTVEYTGNDVELTITVMNPNARLSARLTLEDHDAASAKDLGLNIRGEMDSQPDPFGYTLKGDGTVSFVSNRVLYAGHGRLTTANPVSLPSDFYVARVRQGNRDVLIDGFEVRPDADSPLDIVVSGAGGLLRGKVIDSAGKPVLFSEIALVPQGALAARSDWPSTYRTSQTDQNGNYEFRGLIPGDYRVYAVARFDGFAFWDPSVTQPFHDFATTIHVEKNSKLSADLKLITTSRQ